MATKKRLTSILLIGDSEEHGKEQFIAEFKPRYFKLSMTPTICKDWTNCKLVYCYTYSRYKDDQLVTCTVNYTCSLADRLAASKL